MGETMTRKQQIEQRTSRILHASMKLFCDNGIEDTSVEEIAKEAAVGPATIYRYFDTKAELAISAGIAYWQETATKYVDTFLEEKYLALTGLCQIRCIFHIFVQIFEQEYMFLKFLQEFDIFVRKYQIPKTRLKEYEECILNLKPYVTDALEKGLQDGSLSFPYTVEEVYFSVMHTLLSLMQKLAYNGNILSSDECIDLSAQIRITGELLLNGLARKT